MKKLILLALTFKVCTAFGAAPQPEAVPGEYVVKIKSTFSTLSTRSLSQQLGMEVKTTLSPESHLVVVKTKKGQKSLSAISTLTALKTNGLVEYAEPNYLYRIERTSQASKYGELWGMNNSGQIDSKGKKGIAGVDIGAEKAWDITTGSKDVIVAVIDTGIDYTLPELKENMWTNTAELNGKPAVDDDKNGFVDDIYGYNFSEETPNGNMKDDHGHGSHCAGTIGANGDHSNVADENRVAGVNWNVRLMGLKFLTSQGSGSLEGAIQAIDYAIKMGAQIMSNSWGGGGKSDALEEAIQRANAAGILFVAAAGNDSSDNDTDPHYPSSFDVPNILAVAAIDNRGELASFSNYGKKSVHVGAPGVNILSTTIKGLQSWSGTSMATPHVSGIAALLKAHEPNLTSAEIKDRIMKTATPIVGLTGNVSTGALANAFNALSNKVPAAK